VSDDVRRLAVQQRRRLVATILSAAENSAWWGQLTPKAKDDYRTKVLTAINTYHDFMLDVITVGDEDPRQDQVVRLLETIHASQLRIEKQPVASG